MAGSGGGAFLQTLKAKTSAQINQAKEPTPRPSKGMPAAAGAAPPHRRKNSLLEMTQNVVRKVSIVRVFNRKISNDTSATSNSDETLAPPMSPITPVRPFQQSKPGSASPAPVQLPQPVLPAGARPGHLVTSSQPELLQPKPSMTKPSTAITAQSSPALLAKPSGRTSLASGDRRVSRLALSNGDDDYPAMRERSASVTSVDSVYGRNGNVPDNFEMQNPLLGGDGAKQTEARRTAEEDEANREKRRSLYVSAGSHLDQSKLLSRRNTRTAGSRLSVTLPPRDDVHSNEPPVYSRDAFSNPECEVPHSPIPPPRKITGKSTTASPARKSTVEEIRRESSTASVGSMSPGQSRLRQKRANSKLLHDKANYSNNVLSNVQGAAEQTLIKLRKQELASFLQSSPKQLCAKVNPSTKASFLLDRYKPEDLAQPLFRLCGKLPKGWETFLEVDMRVKYRQMNPGERIEHDDDRLEQNMKELLGGDASNAADQLSRFRKMHQTQAGAS